MFFIFLVKFIPNREFPDRTRFKKILKVAHKILLFAKCQYDIQRNNRKRG